MAELAQNLSQAAHGMADYKYVVLYEKFCTQCGEAGHTEDQCGKYKTTMCKYWKTKGCLNVNCQYAHGPWEMRRPRKLKCAKVFEIAPRTYVVRGCGDRNTHIYDTCPKQGLIWPLPPRPFLTSAEQKE